LTAFSVRRCSRTEFNQQGGLLLGRRLLRWLSNGSGDCLSACRVASPDETSPLVVSYWMHVEEFLFEDIQVLVIQIEAHLQGAIGHASLAFEEVDDLGKNFIEGHE
jgi:hypothetical protein